MASDRSLDQISTGLSLSVEVLSNYNNFLLVYNNSHSLKGILLPVNEENKLILDSLINICQNTKNNNEESLFCIPDSTLSQTAIDSNINNIEVCTECKRALKTPFRRKSGAYEIRRLVNHGFNEQVLKKKNDISRRGSKNLSEEIVNGNLETKKPKITKKKEIEQEAVKEPEIVLNISPVTVVKEKSNKKEQVISIRKTKERLLKTRANEKIIDLCTSPRSGRPRGISTAVEKKKKPKPVVEAVNDEVASINSPVKMSDVSVYDFVDEDYESEPTKLLYKEGKKSYFIDKGSNSLKLDKRSYKRKKFLNKVSNNSNDEIQSNPGIVSQYYKGTKFSINNIVWAKIPGYPFWPAHIKSFDNVSASKSQGKRCRINWIGWNQKSFLPLKSLLHFKDHFKVKYSPKIKSQKYKTAIELACKEMGLDFYAMTLEVVKKSSPISDRNTSSQHSYSKLKSIDLDDIFPAKNGSAKDIMKIDVIAKAYSDEDTDEEEKARSVLITAESLEPNKLISGLMCNKSSDYDY